jgi:hypothetical protein
MICDGNHIRDDEVSLVMIAAISSFVLNIVGFLSIRFMVHDLLDRSSILCCWNERDRSN